MNILIILVPVSLFLAGGAMVAFIWTIRHNQYDDLKGSSERILIPDKDLE